MTVYKIVTRLVRKEGMEQEAFLEYWENEHAPLVAELPNVRVLRTSVPADGEDPPWDGVAEVYFETREELDEALESDAAERVAEDAKEFTEFDAPAKDVRVVRETTQFDETA